MTTTDDVTPIRINGPEGLLAVVPSMLGFHPTNSLVLMCLSGDRRRVGPVARVDLPQGHDRAMAVHLTNHARNHADEVVVVSYQDSRRRPPLLDDLLTELARAGIDVMDAIAVRAGRARPAMSAAMERAHPGIPVPDPDDPQVCALAAAGVLAGRSVLTDREQLRRSIAGPTGDRLRRAELGVDDAIAGRFPTLERAAAAGSVPSREAVAEDQGHPRRIGAVPDEVCDLLDHAFTRLSVGGEVGVEVATAVAVVLTDVTIRDAVLARGVMETDQPWLPMLISCATWTPDALASSLCSVLAMVAYRHGDGALAQIAVDRCLAAEPGHRLAHLMIAIMSAGMRPEELERIARGGVGQHDMTGDDLECEDLDCDHPACNDLDDDGGDDIDDEDRDDEDRDDEDRDDEDRDDEDRDDDTTYTDKRYGGTICGGADGDQTPRW